MFLKVVSLAILFICKLSKSRTFNVVNYIHRCYGENSVKCFHAYKNCTRKLEKINLDLEFLQTCRAYNTIPKFLRFKLYKKSLLSSSFYKSWQSKLLISEISSKRKALSNINNQINKYRGDLQCCFSKLTLLLIEHHVKRTNAAFVEQTKSTHRKKLRNLGINGEIAPCDPDSVIFNFSSLNLPPRMKFLLAFGLEFNLPLHKLNFYKYFLSFEKLAFSLKQRSASDFSKIKNSLKTLAFKYYYNFKPYKVFSSVFSNSDMTALKNLSNNKDIIISKPDKGKGVVILDRSQYVSSMENIIADTSKFKLISEPIHKFTTRIEDKINNFLRKLRTSELLSDDLYKRLYVSGSGPGVLYGLPKIHKPNFKETFPFRPIFAAYRTPSFKLAKFLVPILAPFTTNEYTVNNSKDFVDSLSSVGQANSYFMASFDVTNLFTNIPLRETIDICLDLLFASSDTVLGLSRNFFKTLLELSVLNSFFIFNEKMYQQLDGLGMGLPLGPTFANIFLSFYEKKWLDNCPLSFKPTFYRRYVDDTFILFKEESHCTQFLNYLNSQHPSIKFTSEVEKDCKLSFLDVLVHKENSQFRTSVFRKPTFTGLGMSFFSFCSFRFKINSVKTLLSRAYKVCSDFDFMHREFDFLKKYFVNNGYPSFFIDSHIKKFLDKIFIASSPVMSASKQQFYFSLPYFGHQSEKLRLELLNLLSKHFTHIDFKIVLVNKFSIGSLFNFKDKLSKGMLTSIVYRHCCAKCASDYVGSTTRTLRNRVCEHAGRSSRTNNILSSPPHSAIRSHAEKCDLPVRLEDFAVLGGAPNVIDLRILESLFIQQSKPKLNDMQSAFPLQIVN